MSWQPWWWYWKKEEWTWGAAPADREIFPRFPRNESAFQINQAWFCIIRSTSVWLAPHFLFRVRKTERTPSKYGMICQLTVTYCCPVSLVQTRCVWTCYRRCIMDRLLCHLAEPQDMNWHVEGWVYTHVALNPGIQATMQGFDMYVLPSNFPECEVSLQRCHAQTYCVWYILTVINCLYRY